MGHENHFQQWLHSFGTLLVFPNKPDFLLLYINYFYYDYNRKCIFLLIHRDLWLHALISCSASLFLWISCVFPTLFPKWSLTFCQAIVLFHFRVVASKYFCPSPSWVLCLSSVSDVLWLLGSHLSSTVLSHSYEWLCQHPHGCSALTSWDSQLHCSHSLCTSLSLLCLKNHFFCEVPAMLVLSCVVTTHYERGVYVSVIIFLLITFFLIFASYVQILIAVLQVKSWQEWKNNSLTVSFMWFWSSWTMSHLFSHIWNQMVPHSSQRLSPQQYSIPFSHPLSTQLSTVLEIKVF